MAKILVADDNSNIQKMVVLALKDQGIDVVAVGNGEAAVRKITDIKPDLVLADVFMPVRNGYEVCKFVKEDPNFAHIPVILLVGAFDPLDEQEAQRVGADGVLKKPFVPPDPLIAMVKAALIRAGVPLRSPAAAAAPEAVETRAAGILAAKAHTEDGPASMRFPGPAPAEATISESGESFLDEGTGHRESLRIDAGSQPVAFGSLLDSAKNETDEDLGLPPADAAFADGREWGKHDSDDSEEDEGESESGWRPEISDKIDEIAARAKPNRWNATQFEAVQEKLEKFKSVEAEASQPVLSEVAQAASGGVEVAESFVTETPVTKPMEVIATQSETPAYAAEPSAELPQSVPAEITRENSAETEIEQGAVTASAYSPESLASQETQEIVEAPLEAAASAENSVAQPRPVVAPKAESSGNSWYSTVSSPWEVEAQKASKLASAWDSAISGPGAPAAGEVLSPTASNGNNPAPMEAVPVQLSTIEHATEAIREQLASVTGSTEQAASVNANQSMDDVVARVLAKMSPEVLQAVTREILKPVVEAMVKEELKSKK